MEILKNLLITLAGFSAGTLITACALAFVLGAVYSRLRRTMKPTHLCFYCGLNCTCPGDHMLDCEGCLKCNKGRS